MLREVPATGRTVSITNLTRSSIGVAGTVIGPYKTKTISLRYIEGHPTHATKLATLVSARKARVTYNSDALSTAETRTLDAPISAELRAVRDVFTNVLTVDPNAVKTAFAAPAVATTYSGTALNGVFGTLPFDYARNVTIRTVTGGGEATVEKIFVVTGLDLYGQPLIESITVAARGAGEDVTTQGTSCFKSVTSIYVPADASGAPGDHEVGFGKVLGLSKSLTQGGLLGEFYDNAVPGVAGTVALAAAAAPFGSYTPNDTPNDAHDWVIMYIPG
jgi:hypothetical protein